MDSDTSETSIHKIVYINNTPLIYVEDPENVDDTSTFGTDRELFHSPNNSGDMSKLIKNFKDNDNLLDSDLNNSQNIDVNVNSYADPTVSMTRQQTLSEKLINVSSLFDSTHDISVIEHLSTEDNPSLKDLLISILEKMEEYENKINCLNDIIIKDQSENMSVKNNSKILEKDIANLKKDNKILNTEIKNLNEEMYYIDSKIIENNQYARKESLIISGIPDNISHNEQEDKVIHILRSIGLTSLSSYNIYACHRLEKKNNFKYPAQTIVRFLNRKIVNYCLQHRDRLSEQKNFLRMNLRFFESLCDSNKKVYDECYNLKKHGVITDFYIRNGFVKIIKDG